MVLSMLSAIQNVKLPQSSSASTTAEEENQTKTKTENSHSSIRATDMSRRKQRNPKPIFNPNENDQEDNNRDLSNSEKNSNPQSEDEISIHEDLHTMVKVEVHEPNPTPPPTSSSAPPLQATPTPPPSTSGRLPTMPPLHLPPNCRNPPEMMLNHTAEMLAKQNMLCFGDVTVTEHPDAPPVPMVIPMVYLYPLPTSSKDHIKYRMFVPLGSGMGPEVLVPPGGPPPQNLPKLEKIRSESSESSGRRSGETTPLDLSKSPDSHKNIRESSDTEDSNPDQRPVRASSKDEIEAQLQFFKAKQLEFLKDQHQKQAAALAAAQAAAVAAQQKSRCEECNINFSKHQNYVAHKKYYCSAVNNQAEKSSPKSSQALPILSDNDDDKSSDDGKSQSRKLSSPSANLIMAGLTSPKDRKEDKEPQLLLKQQELLKEPSDGASASSKISGLLIPPPSLPHFACEGCGIKFKSVSNLQAHQARYCAGLRKASEDAFEAMVIKQKQAAQAAAAQAAAAKLPMLEMMNLLNAKNAEQEKLSSIMMSSMAAAALASAQSGNGSQTAQNGAEDYYCFLCGYKEESVDRLKDHINLHFIGKVKRKHEQDQNGNSEESAKKIKTESSEESESQQLKCQNCDIGFSHLSNFVAHKKYYCRGQQQKSSETNENPAEKQTATTSSPNGKESPK